MEKNGSGVEDLKFLEKGFRINRLLKKIAEAKSKMSDKFGSVGVSIVHSELANGKSDHPDEPSVNRKNINGHYLHIEDSSGRETSKRKEDDMDRSYNGSSEDRLAETEADSQQEPKTTNGFERPEANSNPNAEIPRPDTEIPGAGDWIENEQQPNRDDVDQTEKAIEPYGEFLSLVESFEIDSNVNSDLNGTDQDRSVDPAFPDAPESDLHSPANEGFGRRQNGSVFDFGVQEMEAAEENEERIDSTDSGVNESQNEEHSETPDPGFDESGHSEYAGFRDSGFTESEDQEHLDSADSGSDESGNEDQAVSLEFVYKESPPDEKHGDQLTDAFRENEAMGSEPVTLDWTVQSPPDESASGDEDSVRAIHPGQVPAEYGPAALREGEEGYKEIVPEVDAEAVVDPRMLRKEDLRGVKSPKKLLKTLKQKDLATKSVARMLKRQVSFSRYNREIERLQIELLKLQKWVQDTSQRVVVLVEGLDALSNRRIIHQFLEHLDPRTNRVVSLPKQSTTEQGEWYFQRYSSHLPRKGEIVFLDGSWYDRAIIEPINDICTAEQYGQFLRQVPEFETLLSEDGIHVVKLWLSVSKKELRRRMKKQEKNPLQRGNLKKIDIRGKKRWKEFTHYRELMFNVTHSAGGPWTIIKANNQRVATLESIRYLLSHFEYDGKAGGSSSLTPNPKIVSKFGE